MELLTQFEGSYNYIFLDAQAGSDSFAHIAMRSGVSDEVVIVSEYDPMSAAGIERLKGLFQEDLTYGRTWVLLNKMLPEFARSFSEFLEIARYINPIPWDAEVVRAYAQRSTALDLKHGNDYTLAIMQTLKSLLGAEISNELDTWAKARSAIIRQPLEDQYNDLELELNRLAEEQYRVQRVTRLRIIGAFSVVSFFIMSAIAFGILVLSGGNKQAFTTLTVESVASVFAVIVIFTGLIGLYFYVRTPSSDMVIEEGRLRRRQAELERRLEYLASIRGADLETLIKERRTKEVDEGEDVSKSTRRPLTAITLPSKADCTLWVKCAIYAPSKGLFIFERLCLMG